jgi:hypothetical protein
MSTIESGGMMQASIDDEWVDDTGQFRLTVMTLDNGSRVYFGSINDPDDPDESPKCAPSVVEELEQDIIEKRMLANPEGTA